MHACVCVCVCVCVCACVRVCVCVNAYMFNQSVTCYKWTVLGGWDYQWCTHYRDVLILDLIKQYMLYTQLCNEELMGSVGESV